MKNQKEQRPKPSAPPTKWSQVADWYDRLVGESGSEYHRQIVLPGVLKLLNLAEGDTALDVACGQGVLCRLLHDKKVRMTGVDAAVELIRLARQRSDSSVRYFVGDARNLSFLKPNEFTAAACVLAIQNIHPIQGVFDSAAKVLKLGGRFVVVMMHPAFRGPKCTSWGWDEEAKAQYRRVDRYLIPRKEPIVTHPGKDPKAYTWSFHRPIQSYVKGLARAGLLIDAMEEWASHKVSEPGGRSAAENLARKEIPMFLALRAIKTDRPVVDAEPVADDLL